MATEHRPWAGFVTRTQPQLPVRRVVLAGIGGALGIAVLGLVGHLTGSLLLAAAFGSSCVLIFTAPALPFSQPANVVGGHLITTACGLLVGVFLPAQWWSIAIAVGLGIAVMAALRLTHPPAGGNAIVVLTAGASWSYLLVPMLAGAVLLVLTAWVFHRLTGTDYPGS